MKIMMVTAALAVAVLAGCGDDSEDGDAGSTAAPSTSGSTTSASDTATPAATDTPSEPATTAAAVVKLPEACEKFAAGWIGNTTKKAYTHDAALAQSMVDAGDEIVVSAFQPVATIAASAAETLGTTDYLDDEEAYDNEIVKLNGACELVGFPIFTE